MGQLVAWSASKYHYMDKKQKGACRGMRGNETGIGTKTRHDTGSGWLTTTMVPPLLLSILSRDDSWHRRRRSH